MEFSVLVAPLHQLTRRNVAFRWTKQCQQAFEKVKELLMQYSVLHLPSSNSVFVLETDASDLGTGHCLKALEVTGSINDIKTFAHSNPDKEHIVADGSRKFDDTEYWNIVEKEATAIMDAVRKYRHYLTGRKVLLRTDNCILTYLMSKREPKSRKLLGWALELSEYDFDIQHVQSRSNGISDCLSRLHLVNLLTHLQPEMSLEEFHQAQLKDPYLVAAFDYLAANRKKL